ncbi:hypothetical protein F2Q68_00019916 [Brassica cretica]|uniref:Uncharacterized protein n=1 Tax=Brassica cretica TaxID=69181 RepID=A0A8S9G2E5_BRACR|nr:hypothetical protein F2Q68_00019916 [Brassica cretica]
MDQERKKLHKVFDLTEVKPIVRYSLAFLQRNEMNVQESAEKGCSLCKIFSLVASFYAAVYVTKEKAYFPPKNRIQLKVVMSASAEVACGFSGNDDDEDRWQVVMVKLVWFVVVSTRYTKDGMMLLTYTTLLCNPKILESKL